MASGIVIIDKSPGWTSMDVCAKIRGILKEKRVGHGGTLDPMATGVLPVFVGQATRAVEFAENGEKEYIAVCGWGWSPTPRIHPGKRWRPIPSLWTGRRWKPSSPAFTGPITQIPAHVFRHQDQRPKAL